MTHVEATDFPKLGARPHPPPGRRVAEPAALRGCRWFVDDLHLKKGVLLYIIHILNGKHPKKINFKSCKKEIRHILDILNVSAASIDLLFKVILPCHYIFVEITINAHNIADQSSRTEMLKTPTQKGVLPVGMMLDFRTYAAHVQQGPQAESLIHRSKLCVVWMLSLLHTAWLPNSRKIFGV